MREFSYVLAKSPITYCVIVMAVLLAPLQPITIAGRLVRNSFMPNFPASPPPRHAPCTNETLVQKATLVVTVKDTCSQKYPLLAHLAEMFPHDMKVIYAFPDIRGCNSVKNGVQNLPFTDFTELKIGAADPPIQGFLLAQKYIKTPYAVLMHNDAYPMEQQFVCEMVRALDKNPHYPIAAPIIYEKGSKNIYVPHGHHENLHIRESKDGPKQFLIDYDLSFDLVTRRREKEFKEEPQVDFLEDHAYMARTDVYDKLLDPGGSFTMEYLDMILNMRARNTSAWFVPTARVVFDVALSKLEWADLPYLVYKRSEEIGHQVMRYLTEKWDVNFANTGIWNYVRFAMLSRMKLTGAQLPTAWEDQAAVFVSWFQSVGFNRYQGQDFPTFVNSQFEHLLAGKAINISRTLKPLGYAVPAARVPPQPAHEFLSVQEKKKWYIPAVSFSFMNLPIGVRIESCNIAEQASYNNCGMVVHDPEAESPCQCYTYSQLFDLEKTMGIEKIGDLVKLPTRALMFAQMKYLSKADPTEGASIQCSKVMINGEGANKPCHLQASFSPTARIVQWSWFGDSVDIFRAD